jgi:peptidoglycan-associated lipoprotein
MRRSIVALAAVVALAGSTACATKKYVRTQTGEVDAKVDGLSKQVEQTQGRVQANEAAISATDQKAGAAGEAAGRAQSSADMAANRANEVNGRVDEVDKASRRLLYEVVLSDDKARFKFGKAEIADEARVELDRLAQQLLSEQRAVWVEIEGHTDNVGDKKTNERLALQRAENVKKYLYETHKVPLHKINVISYGEDKPVAPNKTKDGRSQNRRVVVRVLA